MPIPTPTVMPQVSGLSPSQLWWVTVIMAMGVVSVVVVLFGMIWWQAYTRWESDDWPDDEDLRSGR